MGMVLPLIEHIFYIICRFIGNARGNRNGGVRHFFGEGGKIGGGERRRKDGYSEGKAEMG